MESAVSPSESRTATETVESPDDPSVQLATGPDRNAAGREPGPNVGERSRASGHVDREVEREPDVRRDEGGRQIRAQGPVDLDDAPGRARTTLRPSRRR